MKKIISVLICACMLVSCFVFGASADDNALRFNSDGKFTVLQITDPQDDAYIAHGLKEFIEKAIEETDPDFIVLTGDIEVENSTKDISITPNMSGKKIVLDLNGYTISRYSSNPADYYIIQTIGENGVLKNGAIVSPFRILIPFTFPLGILTLRQVP